MTIRCLVAAATAAALAVVAGPAGAADFYKGKVVTMMIPSGLGASMGLYGRVLAGGLEKHIPGNPTVILQERPGAGGVTGTAYAYNAGPKDGTYFSMLASGNIVQPLLRDGIKYDVTKMQWLGSIAVRPSVLYLWHTAPVNSIADAKKTEVILGSVGLGSGMSIWPRLLNEMLGTKFKVVEGYKGGAEADLAAQRGETQGRWTSYSALTAGHEDWFANKQIKVLLQFGAKIPRHKDVPLVDELVSGDNLKIVKFMELSESVGLGFWVRPGVPKEQVDILSAGIMAVGNDPVLRAEAAKRGVPFDPLTGAQIADLVKEAYSLTPAQIQRIHSIFGHSKKKS